MDFQFAPDGAIYWLGLPDFSPGGTAENSPVGSERQSAVPAGTKETWLSLGTFCRPYRDLVMLPSFTQR